MALADLFKPNYTRQFPSNPAVAQAVKPRSVLQTVGDFIDSPTGKLATSAVGTFLDARDQKGNRDAQLTSDAADRASREKIAQMGQLGGLQTAEMGDARSRAAGVLDANPLGAEQQYSAREAFLRNAAGLFGNTSITPSDPAVAATMPKMAGGFQITPDFIQAMQQAHSQDSVNGALAQRRMDTARLDPGRGMATSIGDPALDSRVSDFAAQQQSQAEMESKMRRDAILRALDNNPTAQPIAPEPEKKKGSSIWKKIGKVAAIAAPIVAAPFTGGASLAAIGALSGAASSAMNGGGVKGALMGGAMGAFTGGMGGAGNSAAQIGAKAALQKALLNPQAIARMGTVLPGKAGQVSNLANTALSFRR